MTLDQAKEFVVQEKRDAKARLVINDELSSVCHCCTALKYRCKSLYGFAFENTIFPYINSLKILGCTTNQDVLLPATLR